MSDIEEQRLGMLRRQAMVRFGLAAVLIPIILYALAGTLRYWQGWLYGMILIVPMLAAVSYLLKNQPELLERRMKYRERESEQQKIVSVGTIIFVVGLFKENSYACRTIEVVEGQRVINSGPYAIIRHPMYLGVLLMYLLTPIALGSLWAVPIFSLFIPLLVWRIIAEEKILLRDLPGYSEYCRERKYRLLPHIW